MSASSGGESRGAMHAHHHLNVRGAGSAYRSRGDIRLAVGATSPSPRHARPKLGHVEKFRDQMRARRRQIPCRPGQMP